MINASEALIAANLADTIALAFETNGLEMDWKPLHLELCDIEMKFVGAGTTIQTDGIVQAMNVTKWIAIIRQAVARVEKVFADAMAESARFTRAVLAR